MTANRKLEGSSIVDFIPQIQVHDRTPRKGTHYTTVDDPVPCPLQCPDCYYNLACEENTDWVKSAGEPPTGTDAIVRVNSGLDSNLWKDIVLERTKGLRHRFYNTSLPNFNFPGPVVFTANPGWLSANNEKFHPVPTDRTEPNNIMFVRFRVSEVSPRWVALVRSQSTKWIAKSIPVVLMFMRYQDRPPDAGFRWEHTKHFDHKWWQLASATKRRFYAKASEGRTGIYVCGGVDGDERCATCRLCESLYWLWYSRHNLTDRPEST